MSLWTFPADLLPMKPEVDWPNLRHLFVKLIHQCHQKNMILGTQICQRIEMSASSLEKIELQKAFTETMGCNQCDVLGVFRWRVDQCQSYASCLVSCDTATWLLYICATATAAKRTAKETGSKPKVADQSDQSAGFVCQAFCKTYLPKQGDIGPICGGWKSREMLDTPKDWSLSEFGWQSKRPNGLISRPKSA